MPPRLILAAALLLCACPVRAVGTDYLQLVSPRPGETLRGGQWIEIAWQPGPDLSALRSIHEWEAFLSVDGGHTFALRITPHLSIQRRSYRVQVPNVPAADMRLMLRCGDEVREYSQAIAGSWAITRSDAFYEPPMVPALERGESARPGDPGVISWIVEQHDTRPRRVGLLVVPRAFKDRPVLISGWHLLMAEAPPPPPRFRKMVQHARNALGGLPARPMDLAVLTPTLPRSIARRLLDVRFNE